MGREKLIILLLVSMSCIMAAYAQDAQVSTAEPEPEITSPEPEPEITSPEPEPEPMPPKVLIVGGGIAGISAAKKLKAAGVEFVLLEASDKLGGRIQTHKMGDQGQYTVELGNFWISGGKGDPIYDWSKTYNVSLTNTESLYEDYLVVNETGMDVTEAFDEEYDTFELADEFLKNKTRLMLKENLNDLDQATVLMQGGWTPKTTIQYALEQYEKVWTFSVPLRDVSSKYTAGAEDEDEEYIAVGLDKLIAGFADGVLMMDNVAMDNLKLSHTVTEIHQNKSHAIVVTESGDSYEVEQVIVTASLGVLKHRLIDFVPELPPWKVDAIDGFGFVDYINIYCRFQTAWMMPNTLIVNVHSQHGYFPIWINFDWVNPGSSTLQVSAFDADSKRLNQMTDEQIRTEIISGLRAAFGQMVPDIVEFKVSRFGTDPLFMGAYPVWPPRYTMASYEDLKASVGRVHFAGEYANEENYNKVLGSYLSGFDVADQVSKCVKSGKAEPCGMHIPINKARGCTYRRATNYDRKARVDDQSCTFPPPPPSGASMLSSPGMLVMMMTVMTAVNYIQ